MVRKETRKLNTASLDLTGIVRSGDQVVWGHGCGEPATLVEALLEQAAAIGGVRAFSSSSFSALPRDPRFANLHMSSMGAVGTMRALAESRELNVVPCHGGQVENLIAWGNLPCDVAMVQVAHAPTGGRYSWGLISDYTAAAVARARVVIAEVNHRVPATFCREYLPVDAIDFIVETDRPLTQVSRGAIGKRDRAIARFAAEYIGDGCVLQIGVGAVPEAIAQQLCDRRDLGMHSGMVGDSLVDLVEAGALTNATKPIDRGVTVTGAIVGTDRIYRFAHANRALVMGPSSYTNSSAVLEAIPKLVSVNSAVEVDITGQVNAEQIGDAYMGGTGGQVDFVRAGARSSGGRSLIVLPSTARDKSRIVPRLSGPVTTARADADVIVTEFGAAELKGQTMAERARRLTMIAHPDHREVLEEQARAIARRGY